MHNPRYRNLLHINSVTLLFVPPLSNVHWWPIGMHSGDSLMLNVLAQHFFGRGNHFGRKTEAVGQMVWFGERDFL
jgi:hypothetical protein